MPLYKQNISYETENDLPECDVLCVFQTANEDFFLDLKAWLAKNSERYLVLLDEEADIHSHLLRSSLLDDSRVRHYLLSEVNQDDVFKQIAWEFVFLSLGFHTESECTERAKEIFSKITFFHTGVHLFASDYRDLGVRVLKNIFANVLHLPKAMEGEKLAGRFQNIPAIICGAGPSLEKNIQQLSQLSNRAFIFAGGSSLNVLSKHAIDPHFSASIDPDPPYTRFLQQTAFEAPFFYQHRLSRDLLRIVHAPLLRLTDGAGYPIDSWLSSYLGLSSHPFEAGWNVATFLSAIAASMGCNPIIFVGMDLAFSGNIPYANGVHLSSLEEERIELKGEDGSTLFSKKDWIIAAEWIESFAQDHSGTTFVNASEGGIGFKGVENLSLRVAEQKYLKKDFDLKGTIHTQLAHIQINKPTHDQVLDSLTIIESSLSRCQGYVEHFLEAIERSYPNLSGMEGREALFEVEMENEIAYQHILAPIWEVWKPVFARQADKNKLGQILNKLLFLKKAIYFLNEDYDRREI